MKTENMPKINNFEWAQINITRPSSTTQTKQTKDTQEKERNS